MSVGYQPAMCVLPQLPPLLPSHPPCAFCSSTRAKRAPPSLPYSCSARATAQNEPLDSGSP
eukprot:7881987-Alexandrium_andersonii.AAC.1